MSDFSVGLPRVERWQAIEKALKVLVYTNRTVAYLKDKDPKALEQAWKALNMPELDEVAPVEGPVCSICRTTEDPGARHNHACE